MCDPSKESIGTGTSGRRVGLLCPSCSPSLLRFRDRSGDGDGGAPNPTWATPKNEDMCRLDDEFLKGTNSQHVIQRVEGPNLPLLRNREGVGVEARDKMPCHYHSLRLSAVIPLPTRLCARCLTGVVVSSVPASRFLLCIPTACSPITQYYSQCRA